MTKNETISDVERIARMFDGIRGAKFLHHAYYESNDEETGAVGREDWDKLSDLSQARYKNTARKIAELIRAKEQG